MARKEKMVTRTVTFTDTKFMFVNIADAKLDTTEYSLIGKLSKDEALSILREKFDTENNKVVSVTEVSYDERLYGMKESDFVVFGQWLPNRKVYNHETSDDETIE